MDGKCMMVKLQNPLTDAISKICFAPLSNNLLFSSWDSVLRLYDVDNSELRLESPSEAALLSCCFQEESVAFSVGTDGCIRRYDLCSGIHDKVGNHEDMATCVEYSEATNQVITAGLDKKIIFSDFHMATRNIGYSMMVGTEVESIAVCGLRLLVAIGSTVEMYDLRNLKEAVQIKDTTTGYRISCISPIYNCEGFAVGSIEGRVALRYLNESATSEMGCVFRCYPKAKDGRYHTATVNDIEFHPCYGIFATGDNDGHAIIWDGQSRKRLFEIICCLVSNWGWKSAYPCHWDSLQRYPSSVASLSFNKSGQLLAVASSYTYQEANELEAPPQIFIHEMDANFARPTLSGTEK